MPVAKTIAVDPAIFPSIDAYYEKESADVLRVKSYVQSNCTLDSSFGVLLSLLKPKYDAARDHTFTALDTVANTLDKLAQQVEGYAKDVAANETSLQAQVTSMQAQLDAMQSEISGLTASPSGSGASFGGGGGGGGGTPVPHLTAPAPVTSPPAATVPTDPAPPVTTPPVTTPPVTTPPDDTVPPGTTPPASTAPAGPTTIEGGGVQVTLGNNDQVTIITGNNDVMGDNDAVNADDAHDAALYAQLWQDEAAHDPLGRSADQLREAWEASEPIPFDPASLGTLQSGAPIAIPVSFALDASVAAPAPIFTGATR
jgi:uncharacterized protein YukE